MNGKLKLYFEQLGFNVQGNNAYGSLNNYEVSVNVVMLDHVAPVKLHVNLYASKENKGKILRELQNLRLKYFIASADAYGITLGFNDPWTVGRLIKRMPEMLDKIFAIFTKLSGSFFFIQRIFGAVNPAKAILAVYSESLSFPIT